MLQRKRTEHDETTYQAAVFLQELSVWRCEERNGTPAKGDKGGQRGTRGPEHLPVTLRTARGSGAQSEGERGGGGSGRVSFSLRPKSRVGNSFKQENNTTGLALSKDRPGFGVRVKPKEETPARPGGRQCALRNAQTASFVRTEHGQALPS